MASYPARAITALALLHCAACRQQQPVYRGHVTAGDACSVMQRQMPKDDLQNKLAKARIGNLPAEKEVWGYYAACDDQGQANYWEDRLVRVGDADALAARSDQLFTVAHGLDDHDPRKLSLLKQSLSLEGQARKARAGRVLHVTVNGKIEDITMSGEPNEGTRTMQDLLARVEAAQHK